MKKKIFSYNSNINKNAYLNWRTEHHNPAHNLRILGDAYSKAALRLIVSLLVDNVHKEADIIIMPILYDINQSIEVYIKAIIRLLEEFQQEKTSNYTSHDIKELNNIMISKIKKKEKITTGLQTHLKPLIDYINELYEKIEFKKENGGKGLNIDFARYPMDVNGNDHFYIKEYENVIVDLENLKERFNEVVNALRSLYDKFSYEKEAWLENLYLQQQESEEYLDFDSE